MSGKRVYDIGLVVPLKEEFRYVTEIAAVKARHAYDGTYLYELDFQTCTTIACIVGDMGPLPASQATNRLLAFADVKLVILLGLAGAVDKDVLLADVVIADEVNEFLARSKAVEAGAGYEFRFSGRHSHIGYRLRETVNHFDVSGGDCLLDWRRFAQADFEAQEVALDGSLRHSPPNLYVGKMASGDVVGAATAFTKELLEIDRNFLAIDMEAAGVMKAASDRLYPVQVLIIRGISDFADERKTALDEESKGGWRKLCVRNATSLLCSLLRWDDFCSCVGLAAGEIESDELTYEPGDILARVEERPGGAWGVGVLFGLHSQAPQVSENGEVVAVDIAAARVSDERLNQMMVNIERVKSAMHERSIAPESASEQLSQAIIAFGEGLNATALDMLRQFDDVILAVLEPLADGDESELLNQALDEIEGMIDDQRLDEAEQVLIVLDERHGRVRELLADVHFDRRSYEKVIRLLENCEPETLSRRELEHLIISSLECSQSKPAKALLRHHTSAFDDAAGRVFRGHVASRYSDGNSSSEKTD